MDTPENLARRLARSTPVKLIALAFVNLVLILPLVQVMGLIDERASRQIAVAEEVAATWSGPQTLTGPILIVPYEEDLPPSEREVQAATKAGLLPPEPGLIEWDLYRLPKELHWTGTLEPQIRRRGIFETVVYEARLTAKGTFPAPDWSATDATDRGRHLWMKSRLVVGIAGLKGLTEQITLTWNGRPYEFQPGTASLAGPLPGLHVSLRLAEGWPAGTTVPFEISLVLRGSQELQFFPAGDDTSVVLKSTWPSPGFVGSRLPQERTLGESGFEASWRLPHLGRTVPQQWTGRQAGIPGFNLDNFGVRLVIPADAYQKSERSVKYGILFILLTTLTFFLIELASPVRLQAIHYLLVGLALVLFYLLLLALSEQLGFGAAYTLAAIACTGLIAAYARSILASNRWALALLACLGSLYGYLYGLIQAEDLSLLMGAIGLFAILATVMFLTRKLDWGSLRFRD